MILEVAQIDIKAGSASAFETSMQQAVRLLRQVQGFRSYELLRSIEVPDRYRLLVRWDSVESHTSGFQKSALFQQWRGLLGGYFERTPSVEHMEFLATEETNLAGADRRSGKHGT
jgi:heme-degrading monooxygenase HmoA